MDEILVSLKAIAKLVLKGDQNFNLNVSAARTLVLMPLA